MDTFASVATILGTVLVILGAIWKFGKWQQGITSHLERQDERIESVNQKIDVMTDQFTEWREERRNQPPPRRGGGGGLFRSVLGMYLHR